MKNLILMTCLIQLGCLGAAKAETLTITQESGFQFMYEEAKQRSLLSGARQIVQETLVGLGCGAVRIDTALTQKMYRPNLLELAFGERDIEPRFEFNIETDCPKHISNLQTYVSFAFHTSDIDTVFYYAYVDTRTGAVETAAIVDPWFGSLQKENSFRAHQRDCQSTWVADNKYNLLLGNFCR